VATAIGRGTNKNQLKAIRGSKRNGGSGSIGDGGKGDVNNDSNQDGDGAVTTPTLTLSALPPKQYYKEPS
jgi:hypothetical protein